MPVTWRGSPGSTVLGRPSHPGDGLNAEITRPKLATTIELILILILVPKATRPIISVTRDTCVFPRMKPLLKKVNKRKDSAMYSPQL